MCRDCGCEQGNARAYFEHAGHDHGHVHPYSHGDGEAGHSHAHGHSHTQPHVHPQAAGAAEIHIHIHLPEGLGGGSLSSPHVHSHVHEQAEHLHDHEPMADHAHGAGEDYLNHKGHRHVHEHRHSHEHEHDGAYHRHEHAHSHEHSHEHGDPAHQHQHLLESGVTDGEFRTRTIELESKILARNDEKAAQNRGWLKERGVVAVNIISSPGSGKTMLLEKTLEALRKDVACAVIVGDQQTDRDAQRLMDKGAPVVQIETKSSCHLNAEQVAAHLESVVQGGVKLLFIENVGNLVCPAAFDLGEEIKIALLSVTEGEDKPLKYPVLFHDAPVTVVTKTDLLPHLDVSMDKARAALRQINPHAQVFELSAKTGEGMGEWIDYLKHLLKTP